MSASMASSGRMSPEEALAIGLYAAMVANSFEACIELAANHDGDSDSTASIAGQLWGARHGLAETQNDVVSRLDVLEPLFDVFREWADCPWSNRLTP